MKVCMNTRYVEPQYAPPNKEWLARRYQQLGAKHPDRAERYKDLITVTNEITFTSDALPPPT